MKYMEADPTKETSCKECIFAIYENDTQTGCTANKIEQYKDKIIEAYDEDREFFVVNGICTLKRPLTWNDGKADVAKATHQISQAFDIIIDISYIELDTYNSLKNVLANIDYYKDRYKFLLICNQATELYRNSTIKKINTELGYNVEIIYDNEYGMQNLQKKCSGTYSIRSSLKNMHLISNSMNELNNEINNNLKKVILYRNKDLYILSNFAWKLIYSKLDKDFEKNIQQIITDTTEKNLFLETAYETENSVKKIEHQS